MLPYPFLCRGLLLASLAGLPGCTQVPELGGHVATDLRNADYPRLLPLGTTLARSDDDILRAEQVQGELAWRRAQLRRKAQRLQSDSRSESQ